VRLSEERIEVIAGRLADRLLDEELVDITLTERAFLDQLEIWLTQDLEIEDEINEAAIEHGSDEWETLLEKAKDELARARGYVIR
jgi:hypothetical protein